MSFTPLEMLFIAELVTKFILITLLIIGSSIFIRQSSNAETSAQKYFFLGISLFGFFYASSRLFFIFTDFRAEIEPIYLIFWKLAAISILVSLIFFEVIIETYITKGTKYVFTVIAIAGTVLTIFLGLNEARILSWFLSPLLLVNILGVYVYVSIKNEGDIRSKGLKSILGLGILVFGIIVDGSLVANLVGFDMGIVGAILMMIGLGIYFAVNYQEE